ncbi:hypothetical protein [Paenarthrobacter sp. YJN-5]|uniref:hypothetical protein n=1 Tax=Paenarthrobacter sp. YJN-5 TaxID=2735316 RepID=UPI001877737D|nr:hypothetical protein [Paenarthrobacter sp. YJN-5]QOT19787.1 hypothetical protein HMI59_24330 [Paenarthrobacter sp. YJN-5]
MADEQTRPAPTFDLIEKGFSTISAHTEVPTNQSVADVIASLTSNTDAGTSSGADKD